MARARLSWLLPWLLLLGCGEDSGTQTENEGPDVASDEVDAEYAQTGAWEATVPRFTATYYVRPPGQTDGIGDGSSWENAFPGLPEVRVRGARYLFAAGDYHVTGSERVETYVLDDPEAGEAFIWLVKATEADHGDDAGWSAALGEGPAELGALSFVTGHYIVDGSTGAGASGHGFYIHHRDCPLRNTDFIASPVFFPWDSATEYLSIRHTEIEDCGTHDSQEVRSQDAVYAVVGPSHVVIGECHVHDSWRNHLFLQGSLDVLVEDNTFARAGMHHEANSIALRNSRNIVIRRNTFVDSLNTYVSLQTVRNVTLSANVLTRTLDGWNNWAAIFSQEPAYNVLIAGNTFYNLTGLNGGIRFTDTTENLQVVNNLWAGCRVNQIMLNGEHRHNAFHDNLRVDGDAPVSLDPTIEEETAELIAADPFVDAASLDFRLATGTEPGEPLTAPFAATDRQGAPRTRWDRGAFEFVE